MRQQQPAEPNMGEVIVQRGFWTKFMKLVRPTERLPKDTIPEASGRPVTTSSAPEKSFVRSPVPTPPPHNSLLDLPAEYAAMKAKLEASELAFAAAVQAAYKRLEGEVRGALTACLCARRGDQSVAVNSILGISERSCLQLIVVLRRHVHFYLATVISR